MCNGPARRIHNVRDQSGSKHCMQQKAGGYATPAFFFVLLGVWYLLALDMKDGFVFVISLPGSV